MVGITAENEPKPKWKYGQTNLFTVNENSQNSSDRKAQADA